MFHVFLPYPFRVYLLYRVPCRPTISFPSLFNVYNIMFLVRLAYPFRVVYCIMLHVCLPYLFLVSFLDTMFHVCLQYHVPMSVYRILSVSIYCNLFHACQPNLVQLTMSWPLPFLCVVLPVCPPYLVQSCSEISYFVLHVIIIIQSLASRLPTHIFLNSVSYPLLPITSYHHQLSIVWLTYRYCS